MNGPFWRLRRWSAWATISFAGSAFTKNQHRGICWRNLANEVEHHLHLRAGGNHVLERLRSDGRLHRAIFPFELGDIHGALDD